MLGCSFFGQHASAIYLRTKTWDHREKEKNMAYDLGILAVRLGSFLRQSTWYRKQHIFTVSLFTLIVSVTATPAARAAKESGCTGGAFTISARVDPALLGASATDRSAKHGGDDGGGRSGGGDDGG